MVDIREYVEANGTSPYAVWFETLNAPAAAKIAVTIARMAQGNLSDVKGVGAGVFERRIEFGPGYRVYFGRDGDRLVILLGGGTKKRQQRDIITAQALWQDYKRRKAQER